MPPGRVLAVKFAVPSERRAYRKRAATARLTLHIELHVVDLVKFDTFPKQKDRDAIALVGGVVRPQSSVSTEKLASLGAEVVELPVIEFAAIDFEAPDWKAYDLAVFTSANTVEALFSRIAPEKGPAIVAIGPATADALRAVGLEPDMVPEAHVAEGVVDALANTPLAGKRVLLPRAAVARDVIPAELSARGASVDVLPVYRTVVPADLAVRAAALFGSARKPDWVTLTSSSTVKNLLAAIGGEMMQGVKLASIGPVTSETALRHGLRVTLEAPSSTVESLADAMANWSGADDDQQAPQRS